MLERSRTLDRKAERNVRRLARYFLHSYFATNHFPRIWHLLFCTIYLKMRSVTKPKPKTAEEMDLEIDAYTMGKDAALSAKLDAEMDNYHASRTTAESSSAPES